VQEVKEGGYLSRPLQVLSAVKEPFAVSLVATLLPVLAVIVVVVPTAIIGVVVALGAGPSGVIGVFLLSLAAALAALVLSAAVAMGGLARSVLEAVEGWSSGVIEPFKEAWGMKGRLVLLLIAQVLIYLVVIAAVMAPVIPTLLGLARGLASAPPEEIIARVYPLLIPVLLANAALKLLLDPAYLFAVGDGRDVGGSLRRSFETALRMAEADPLAVVAYFAAFLFPEALFYLAPEAFLANPGASNLFSIAVWAKNVAVEPFFLAAAALAARDSGLLQGGLVRPRRAPAPWEGAEEVAGGVG